MADSILDIAADLMARGRSAEALTRVRTAAESGDGDALFQMGIWRLIGDPLPRDLADARAWLRRATAAGQPDAPLTEAALTANGTGAPADWAAARRLLEEAATRHADAADQLAVLRAMAIGDDGAPLALPQAETLGTAPVVRRYPELLTPDECRLVATAVQDVMEPAQVVDPRTGRLVAHPIRTSDGAVIGPTRENLVVRAVNRRLAAITGTHIAQGEALTVLRYTPGQRFRPHVDSIAGTRNQRILTVLVYLTQGFAGGETTFMANGLRVAPRIGDAIVFANTLPDGRPDPASQHAGEPVTQGVKWLATRWIRARAFDPWIGPEG